MRENDRGLFYLTLTGIESNNRFDTCRWSRKRLSLVSISQNQNDHLQVPLPVQVTPPHCAHLPKVPPELEVAAALDVVVLEVDVVVTTVELFVDEAVELVFELVLVLVPTLLVLVVPPLLETLKIAMS